MEQRDILMDEIEQMGRVLGKIMTDFLGQKNSGNVHQAIELTKVSLKKLTDLDIEELVSIPAPELFDFLAKKKYTAQQLELINDFLIESGKFYLATDKGKSKIYLGRVIEIYTIIDEVTKTFSFSLMQKKDNILTILSEFE